MYLLQLRFAQAVFSHDTALFLHDIKTGYNPSRLTAEGVKVYTVKKELYSLGVVQLATPFGHTVTVYDPERTVCDIVRSRKSIEAQTFQDALKQYVRRRDKNLHRLTEYAKAFRVVKPISGGQKLGQMKGL